jgi:hypothetical protein
MTPELARRIAELRACENIRELRVVVLDERENRALVLLVPRSCAAVSTGAEWQQPTEPFLMVIDSATLLDKHPLH